MKDKKMKMRRTVKAATKIKYCACFKRSWMPILVIGVLIKVNFN